MVKLDSHLSRFVHKKIGLFCIQKEKDAAALKRNEKIGELVIVDAEKEIGKSEWSC